MESAWGARAKEEAAGRTHDGGAPLWRDQERPDDQAVAEQEPIHTNQLQDTLVWANAPMFILLWYWELRGESPQQSTDRPVHPSAQEMQDIPREPRAASNPQLTL